MDNPNHECARQTPSYELERAPNLQMHPAEEVQAILDLFEGQIAIYEKDTGAGLLRFLRIKKLTNQKYLECELTLRKESLETQNREKNSQVKRQS